jgi:protein involved in polysaccharide export with SLBB domain
MSDSRTEKDMVVPLSQRNVRGLALMLALLAGLNLTGCAALTNPVANGVPVRRLPPEILGKPRDPTVTLPLTLLQRSQPDRYRLDADDVLAVYIEGVLGGERVKPGEPALPPPVNFPSTLLITPSLGYPVTVDEDGTLALPLMKPLSVRGLTVEETRDAIRDAYTKAGILKSGRERILLTLARERTVRITVMRQELGGFNSGPEGMAGVSLIAAQTKRGTGHLVDLPAFQNDVLNALARSGGLPGLDAYDQVLVMRNPSIQDRAAYEAHMARKARGEAPPNPVGLTCQVIRIPLRINPNEVPPLQQEDIILHKGDVVLVEARDLEVFYTGGLIPTAEYVLPRDRDLDVIEALAYAKAPLVSGNILVGTSSSLGGSSVPSRFGFPSPSLLTVIRRLPGGGHVPIRVDLNRALRDPRERIRVMPKDVLVLQETPSEALARYMAETFKLDFTYLLWESSRSTGTFTGSQIP